MSSHLSAFIFRPLKNRVVVPAAVLVFFLGSCEPGGDSVIDYVLPSPVLVSGSVSPTIINTDTINVGPERLPEDVLPLSLVARLNVKHSGNPVTVRFFVYENRPSSPISEGLLYDDGTLPDSTASDSTFSGLVQFQIVRSDIGTISVELVAEANGLQSSSLLHTITIERLNQPPVLSKLQAPDTVHTGEETSFVITVNVSDSDGLADIKSVTRRTPSNLVLPLNDSGANGDVAAGDGVFTETVALTPPPPPGPYQFTFQALDRSNASSNLIMHTIIVMQ
ncbi:MAG TPA: choice-of-anchor X domain-containing protein [Bacteroidota bacterium]